MSAQAYQNKTGVINDPLGQPTIPAGSDCRLILGRTDVRTLCVKIVITTGLVDQHIRSLKIAFLNPILLPLYIVNISLVG